MTMDKDLEARILRVHYVEYWGVLTVAAQLGVHHSVVYRVLAQAGLPKVERATRDSILDPNLPMIVEELEEYPSLSAARLLRWPSYVTIPAPVVTSEHAIDRAVMHV